MGRFRRLDTPHRRRQAFEWMRAKVHLLFAAIAALATVIGLIAGGFSQLKALFVTDAGGRTAMGGSMSTPPEARFELLVAKACDATNRSSHDAARLAGKLQAELHRTHSAVQAKGEVLWTVNAFTNEATDVENILASATSPPAERADQRDVVAALQRNILRLHQYAQRLDLAVTPRQTYAVIVAAGAMVEAVASDRALARSRLLAMGRGDCRLDPISTPAPVFPPAIYASQDSDGKVSISSTATERAARAKSKPKPNIAPAGGSRTRSALKPAAKRRRTHRKKARVPSARTSPGLTPPDIPLPAPAEPPPIPAVPPVTAPAGTSPVAEQETPTHDAETFTSYHEPFYYGPPISAGQWVEVACQVYDPTDPISAPGGYWYLLANAPWSNEYFAPARTFMNGDPENGPYTHFTDLAVPDCVPSPTG